MSWTKIFKNPVTTGFITGASTAVVAAIGDPQHFNFFDPTAAMKLASVAVSGGVVGAIIHRAPTAKQSTDQAVVEALVNAYSVQVMQGAGGGGFIGIVPAFGIQVIGKDADEARKNANLLLRSTITGRILNGMPMPTPDAVTVKEGAISTKTGTGATDRAGTVLTAMENK